MAKLVFAGAYDLGLFAERSAGGALDCSGDKGMTKQSFKDECDINTIVNRFGVGITQVPVGTKAPMYGDFTQVTDFRTALEAVVMAEDSFMTLPAATRARFDNDPAKFVDFCSDGKNAKELVDMGLAVELKEAAPVKVEVVAQPAVAGAPGAAAGA